MGLTDKMKMEEESLARVQAMTFAKPVTNICAGHPSRRHAFFVDVRNDLVLCTDGHGEFWRTGMNVVYPGWLDNDECKRLYEPVWEETYGEGGGYPD